MIERVRLGMLLHDVHTSETLFDEFHDGQYNL